MSPRLLRSRKPLTIINKVERNANNSYISIMDDLEISDDDSLKSQSQIITDLQDKLAIADYELSTLRECLDAQKQREIDHLHQIEVLQVKHDDLSIINLELKLLLEKMTTTRPVQVACGSASAQTTPGVPVQGLCAAASNDMEEVLESDECLVFETGEWDDSAVPDVEHVHGVALGRPTGMDSEPASRPRMLLLADDHGRGAARVIRDRMGSSHEVLSIFKPGATIEEVLADVGRLCAGFSHCDCVVVVAGLNNVLRNVSPNFKVINRRLMQVRHTNIILSSIPYCNRNAVLNTSIYNFNSMFYNNITNNINKPFLYVDVNAVIGSSDIVKNGIHLNKYGMHKLYNYISSNVQAFKPNINTFVNYKNLIELQRDNSLQNSKRPDVSENFRIKHLSLPVN